MNTLKHVIVDGGLGLLIGASIDAIFAHVHEMPTVLPTTTKDVGMAIAKVAAQAFVTIAVSVEISNFVYPESVGDDPTNGFWMLYVLMNSSPHLTSDIQTLVGWQRAFVQTKIFPKPAATTSK